MINQTSSSSGIGFLGLLTIVLVVLRALNYITWSWWLVWLPVYGPIALFGAVMLLCLVIAVVSELRPKKGLRR